MFIPSTRHVRTLLPGVLPSVLPNGLCFLSSMAIMVLELVAEGSEVFWAKMSHVHTPSARDDRAHLW